MKKTRSNRKQAKNARTQRSGYHGGGNPVTLIGTVQYIKLVKEIGEEPNYDEVLEAATKLV